jgi:maltose-binding protein MalE
MKNIFIIVCLILISSCSPTKKQITSKYVASNNNDTIFHHQDFLQKEVDELEEIGFFKIDDEHLSIEHLLKNKTDLEKYVKLLIEIRNSKSQIEKIEISEDRTKELWFVCVSDNAYYGGHTHLVICKKNGKVVIFEGVK